MNEVVPSQKVLAGLCVAIESFLDLVRVQDEIGFHQWQFCRVLDERIDELPPSVRSRVQHGHIRYSDDWAVWHGRVLSSLSAIEGIIQADDHPSWFNKGLTCSQRACGWVDNAGCLQTMDLFFQTHYEILDLFNGRGVTKGKWRLAGCRKTYALACGEAPSGSGATPTHKGYGVFDGVAVINVDMLSEPPVIPSESLSRLRLVVAQFKKVIERGVREGFGPTSNGSTAGVEKSEATSVHLAPRQKEVLQALRLFNAIGQETKRTTAEIAQKISSNLSAESLKAPVAKLKRLGLIETLPFRGGGCWLTREGIKQVELIDSARKPKG